MTAIGDRCQRLVLEKPVETPDGAGGVVRSYCGIALLWGRIEGLAVASAAEKERAGRLELAQRLRITLRWRAGIDGTMRLRMGKRVFSILSVADPDGRRRDLVIVAGEVTP